MDERMLYSTQDVIKMLGMCKSVILKACADGKLRYIKQGTKFYFKKEYLDEYIAVLEKETLAEEA